MTNENTITYISFGAGVQSTTLLLMSTLGIYDCPRADVAIFADTQTEGPWTLKHIEKVRKLTDIPIKICTAGDLGHETIHGKAGLNKLGKPYKKFVSLPVYGLDPNDHRKTAMMARQCTFKFKIEPCEKAVREFLGYKPRQRMKHKVQCLIGISLDEAQRMKPSRTRWVTNAWPLVEARIHREKCKLILKEHGWPVPFKSSCWHCPFHSNDYWLWLQKEWPETWMEAVAFDKAIRNLSLLGEKAPIYLHSTCQPLDEVDFSEGGQLRFQFMNECEGFCGV